MRDELAALRNRLSLTLKALTTCYKTTLVRRVTSCCQDQIRGTELVNKLALAFHVITIYCYHFRISHHKNIMLSISLVRNEKKRQLLLETHL